LILASARSLARTGARSLYAGMILTDATQTASFSELNAGQEYLLTLKGTWDGASATLTIWDDELAAYVDVDGGTYSETDKSEDRIIAVSSKARVVLTGTGLGTSLSVDLLRLPN
jgi:hypothetical protein